MVISNVCRKFKTAMRPFPRCWLFISMPWFVFRSSLWKVLLNKLHKTKSFRTTETGYISTCEANCILANSTDYKLTPGLCKSECPQWQHRVWVALYVFIVVPASYFNFGTIPALLMRLTPTHLKSTQRALQLIANQSVFLTCTFLVSWLQDQDRLIAYDFY